MRFHQLHAPDNSRIQQKRVCAADGEEVPFEEIVKGYEISPGRYVVVDPDELREIIPEATHTIDIEEFVELSQIDPIFYDKAYYLVPDKRAEKPYKLLTEAMARTNKVGIARFVMRTKQYLCALRAVDGALLLSTMLFADEVIPLSGLDGLAEADVDLSDRELAMAEQLIDSLGADFEPEKYTDTYREQILDIIARKADGEEFTAPAVTAAPGAVVDLMAALEASLAAAKADKNQKGEESDAASKEAKAG